MGENKCICGECQYWSQLYDCAMGDSGCCNILRYKNKKGQYNNFDITDKFGGCNLFQRREIVSKKLTIKGSPGDKVYYITEASRAGTKTSLVVCSDEIKKIDIEKEVVYHFTGGNDVTGDMVFANINEAVETIEKKLTEDNGVRRIDMS